MPFHNIFRWHIELPTALVLLILLNGFFELVYRIEREKKVAEEYRETHPKKITVQRGAEFMLLSFDQIAYFNISHDNVFAVTFHGVKFFTDKSLNKLEREVPNYFFRLNRQFIVNISSIESFRKSYNQKVNVQLLDENKTEVVVSKQKVPLFKSWLSHFQE